jgi:hypothetical protein
MMDEIEEKTREIIFNSKFDHKKCGEILMNIGKIFAENNCNNIERHYILTVLQTLETSMSVSKL